MKQKHILASIVFVAMLATGAMAQNVALQPIKAAYAPQNEGRAYVAGLSCEAAFLYADLYSGNASEEELAKRYPLTRIDGTLHVAAFVEMQSEAEAGKLASYGVRINGNEQRMMSTMIPLNRFADLAQSGLCRQIDVAKKMDLHNDRATRSMRSDEANNGHMLPEKYDGTGVIVGIIDIGFEYGHPTFYDTTGTRYRVKCVWDQNMECNTHPAGYNYGIEFLTQSSILNAVCSHTNETHGSHVAGIAAGSGGPGDARIYRGVAPNADLVLVATNMMSTGIYDGINYIKSYASSLGRPCVINMSLGSQVGPHDGSTLFDQMCDTYVGNTPGVLLCASAGNDGGTTLHLEKTFSDADNDTVVTSFLTFSGQANGDTYLDFWGMPGDTFFVQLGVVNTTTGQFEDASYLYSSAYSTNYSTTLTDLDGETCSLDLYCTNADPSNGKPNITIRVQNNHQTSNNQRICVRIVGHNTTVHAWANKASWVSMGVAGAVTGNNRYTAGEIGIGRTMITIGSYMSRQSWTSLSGITYGLGGTEGDISSFSSRGPSVDGRTKPDIVGPGQILNSAINKYNTDYSDPNGPWVVGSVQFNGATEYYATMQGTSMSSPAVAGVMALWLQANPYLTSSQAHQLIHNSGLTDAYTGSIPSTGSNTWGWGKINVYAGLPVTDDTVMNVPCNINVLPYTEDFESPHHCWSATDNEAGSTSWDYEDSTPISGRFSMVSQASTTGTDHVLMSPVISIPAEGENWAFTWKANSCRAIGIGIEKYTVCVVKNGVSKLLYKGELNNQSNETSHGLCLDAYRGSDIRIKITHLAGEGSVALSIDEAAVSQRIVAPQVRIKYNNTTEGNIHVAANESLTFEAEVVNQAKGSSFQWKVEGLNWNGQEGLYQTIAQGDSARLENVTLPKNGEYQVTLYANNEAGMDGYSRKIFVGDVSIDDVAERSARLYPNPTSGIVAVELEGAVPVQIDVVDAMGRTRATTHETTLDLSKLPSGIYFVRIATSQGVVTQRLIKQ